MLKENKADVVKDLVDRLNGKGNFILTKFSGISVEDLTKLRNNFKEKNVDYKVVKNNLFSRALKEIGFEDMDEFLKGPIAVAFTDGEISEVAKICKNFKKESDKFDYFLGYCDGVVYNETDVVKLADLPSKEEVLAKLMSLLNGPASGIARGTNELMASLARGINAVAEQQNNA